MQDKEFDQLMRDKFEEAEIAPSAGLWANIDQELSPKRKRVLPVYRIAAVISIITVGIFFYTREDKNAVHQLALKPALPAVKSITDAHKAPVHAAALQVIAKTTVGRIKVNTQKEVVPVVTTVREKKDLTAMQPLALNNRPDDTKLKIKQDKISLPKPAVTAEEETVLAITNASTLSKDEVINENEEAAPRGIRNIGDLVNYVVDKVDKREEKVIQFKTEDDNSSLIAINIGMFKFNQRKTHK